ncbi:MAG: dimethylarginine dimethylaminohydrolase [Lysobacterales bacterium]|nr:MAG: dimethylarginine dimethylaminohydrolase [Xanthomonadales bacterium]
MPTPGYSWRFSAAIARLPGHGVARGIRAVDRGAPDFERFRLEHHDYVRALERAGLQVTVLPALEAYPDSVFIEDAALCLPEGIVMLRPGAPTRTGEAAALATALAERGHAVIAGPTEGFIDGGDILATETAILVGLSERTDGAACAWLQSVLRRWAYPVLAVRTPDQVLHFKSDCCVLDGDTVLATWRLAGAECFAPFRVLTVPSGEEAAANSIRINDTVLVPAGFPATAELLAREGYRVDTVAVSQASLLDGGLSCMSLRLPAACAAR